MDDRRLMLFGISGSGKTSILRAVQNRHTDGTYITVGDFVLEICKERNLGITSRDQILKELSKNVLLDIQKEAYERIIKKLNTSNSFLKVIDNHLVLRCKDGYFLGFPSTSVLKEMDIDVYYYVYCEPKVIKRRVERDKTRNRIYHENDLMAINNMSLALFTSLVSYFPNSRFYIIDNTANDLNKIVDVFFDKKIFNGTKEVV